MTASATRSQYRRGRRRCGGAILLLGSAALLDAVGFTSFLRAADIASNDGAGVGADAGASSTEGVIGVTRGRRYLAAAARGGGRAETTPRRVLRRSRPSSPSSTSLSQYADPRSVAPRPIEAAAEDKGVVGDDGSVSDDVAQYSSTLTEIDSELQPVQQLYPEVQLQQQQQQHQQQLQQQFGLVATEVELTHESNRLCIASTTDRSIHATSFLAESGNFVNLALPASYDAPLSVECSLTDMHKGEVMLEKAYSIEDLNLIDLKLIDWGRQSLHGGDGCVDRKGFQPGYFNSDVSTWVDGCDGRSISTSGPLMLRALFEEGNCPLVGNSPSKDIWISFVGDHVTRQLYQTGLYNPEMGSEFVLVREWTMPNEPYPEHILGYFQLGGRPRKRVWITFYARTSVGRGKLQNLDRAGIDHTWGDFMAPIREAFPHEEDDLLPFDDDRYPDAFFFGPGYRAIVTTGEQFGRGMDELLRGYHDSMMKRTGGGGGGDGVIPPVHVILNMLPAPWMIPPKSKFHHNQRTILTEYRKNIAVISIARKYDFVHSVVDMFSVEMPFNGWVPNGPTAKLAAVHIGRDERGSEISHVGGRLIVDRICGAISM